MTKNIFLTSVEAAQALITTIIADMDANPNKVFTIALSGGKTPEILYYIWVRDYALYTDWNRINFYWVDERCVPPTSDKSNFKLAYDHLLSKVAIPSNNYYRILGEAPAQETALMYSSLVKSRIPSKNEYPQFDYILLGIGDDGHTSSIFPKDMELLKDYRLYAVTRSPYDDTERVGMTGRILINARHTYFFVTGHSKQNITDQITEIDNEDKYPASYVWNHAHDAQLFACYTDLV